MDKSMDSNDQEKKAPETGTTAIDTGKRVDVSSLRSKGTVIRKRYKRSEQAPNRPKQENTREPDEEKVEDPIEVKRDLKPPDPEAPSSERKITLYVEPLEIDDSGDFASMLKESEETQKASPSSLRVGDKVSGKVVHIGKESVFISLGPKIEAAMAKEELLGPDGELSVRMGQKVTSYVASINDGVTLSNDIAQDGLDLAMLEDACARRTPVLAKVMGVNKGGFDMQIGTKRAFCPIGQIDVKFIEDASSFVGRTLSFLVERIEENGRNIVLSRRALLAREQREKAQDLIKHLAVEQRYEAVITRVTDFGAFADIGGLEGLIPRKEISYGHIDRVLDVVATGDRVEVMVLSFEINEDDPTRSKLVFSLKKTRPDPYSLYWDQIKPGVSLEGRVVRLESFGAFVELFPGIDGLVHISQISEDRIRHPNEVLNVNDPVTVRVTSVDDEEKRIGLSLRESVSKKRGMDKKDAAFTRVERGQKVSGVVSRIERYGVFLELENGASALLPQSETGLPKNSDLGRSFKIQDALDVVVIDVDGQNRIRVSLLARKQMDERDSYLKFQHEEEKKGSFGTLADLLQRSKERK